jgi:cation transporter-like permease
VGGLTVLLGILALVFPPNFVEHYNAPGDGGARVLNTSVMMVGALGVYAALVAVYLTIAAFSLRWAGIAARKGEPGTDGATS